MQKFFVFFVLNLFFLISFSQQQITITTYYPSPVGIYKELMTRKLSVGDANKDGNINSLDLPNLEGSIVFAPQTGDPQYWPAGKEGELAYSRDKASFYYYNGSEWVRQAGYRVCISLKRACPGLQYDDVTGDLQCKVWTGTHYKTLSLPSCPPGWEDVGEGCVITSSDVFSYVGGAGYCERWCCQ